MFTASQEVVCAGVDGSGVGSADSGVQPAQLLALSITYKNSPPSGTVVTIKCHDANGDDLTLLTITGNTDKKLIQPVTPLVDNAGVAVSGQYAPFIVVGVLTVSVASANHDSIIEVEEYLRTLP